MPSSTGPASRAPSEWLLGELFPAECEMQQTVLHELGKRVVLQVSRLWAASAASADGVRDSSWPVALQGDAHLLHSAAAELPPARHS